MQERVNEDFTLPVVSRDDFRRQLAGVCDPDRKLSAGDQGSFRPKAERLVVCLCRHFGDALDRKTLWSRIDSGLQAACAKVSDGDLDRWLDLLLEHVRADPSSAACCADLAGLRHDLTAPDEAHKKAFLRWVETRRFAVLAHGRAAWEAYKETNRQPREEPGQ